MARIVPVMITERSGNDLHDYAVRVVLDQSFPLWGLLDGGNLYFVDPSTGSKLYYYIESLDTTNKQAVIWVRVPSLLANSTKTILMVVGASVSGYNDPSSTFLYYDDSEHAVGQDADNASGSYKVDISSLSERTNLYFAIRIAENGAYSGTEGATFNACLWDANSQCLGIHGEFLYNNYHTLKDDGNIVYTWSNKPFNLDMDRVYVVTHYNGTVCGWSTDGYLDKQCGSVSAVQPPFVQAGLTNWQSLQYVRLILIRPFVDPEPAVTVGRPFGGGVQSVAEILERNLITPLREL